MGCGNSLSVFPVNEEQLPPLPFSSVALAESNSPLSQIRCDLEIILFYRSLRNVFVSYLEGHHLDTLLFLYEDLLRLQTMEWETITETWAYIEHTYLRAPHGYDREIYDLFHLHGSQKPTDFKDSLLSLLNTIADELAAHGREFASSSSFIDFLRSDSAPSASIQLKPKVTNESVRILLFDSGSLHGQVFCRLLQFAYYEVNLVSTREAAFAEMSGGNYKLIIVSKGIRGTPDDNFLNDYNDYQESQQEQTSCQPPLLIAVCFKEDTVEDSKGGLYKFDYCFNIPVSIHEILKIAPVSVSFDEISELDADTLSTADFSSIVS